MKLTIDNLAGAGPVDYSAALSADAPLAIERTLNAPSRCSGALILDAATPPLPAPVRRARVVVSSDAGVPLFTGYLATEPVTDYAGVGLAGPACRTAFTAVSDEWLLDKQTATLSADGYAVPGVTLLSTLANRTAAGALNTAAAAGSKPVGVFAPQATQPFSANAGAIAGASYAAYRALNGALTLETVGSATHALDFDSGGELFIAELKTAQIKELANDVTLTGEVEPCALITEMFQGDGTTSIFQLAEPPFRATRPTLLSETFSQPGFNPQVWDITDPGSHLGLGANGLELSGGTGADGQTTLTAIDQLELGGTLVVEAANVQLAAPSDGVLCGVYSGPVSRTNCFAGYNVRQSGGATLLTPFVNGAEVGTSYTLLNGHAYTLRLRLHCAEAQRVLQTYYARVDGAIQAFGGGLVSAPVALVFDVIDLGNASSTPATVLYDGAVQTSPAVCTFAAVDSLQLTGSIGAFTVTQTGSAWVGSTLPGGATATRLLGIAGEGADCSLSATGKVTFFAGRLPVADELVTISYRNRNRSVARLEDPASVAAEAAGGMPGTARWLGKVVRPPARSSADCEAATQAVLALATDRTAAIAGNYAAVNPADIWPGDVLAITANGQALNVVVRAVRIADGHAVPEVLTYRIAFANDWAESLGITLSEAVAADAYLPPVAATAAGECLADLTALSVISATAAALEIDAGTAPPPGGGFEVRRRDWGFAAGPGADLVLRSPVRSFAIPRAAAAERFYIRQYDASTPPLYSRFSSAIFTNLPVA